MVEESLQICMLDEAETRETVCVYKKKEQSGVVHVYIYVCVASLV